MPCYTIQTTQIDLGKNTNADHMLAALNALKLNALRSPNNYIRFNGGSFHPSGSLTLSGDNAEARAAEIKRAYMTQATMATAAKFGWQVKATGASKFVAIKRTIVLLALASIALTANAQTNCNKLLDLHYRLITGTETTLTNWTALPMPPGFTALGLPKQIKASCASQDRGVASVNGRLVILPANCDTVIFQLAITPTNNIAALLMAIRDCKN